MPHSTRPQFLSFAPHRVIVYWVILRYRVCSRMSIVLIAKQDQGFATDCQYIQMGRILSGQTMCTEHKSHMLSTITTGWLWCNNQAAPSILQMFKMPGYFPAWLCISNTKFAVFTMFLGSTSAALLLGSAIPRTLSRFVLIPFIFQW